MNKSKSKKPKEMGPTAPSSPEADPRATDATIMEAINSLRADLQTTKVEICQTIDTRIEEIATTIRGELSAFKTESQNVILALQTANDQHNSAIPELECSATYSSDAVTKLQSEVKYLSTEMNLRSILRIAMLKERTEKGTEMTTFVSQLLKTHAFSGRRIAD